MIGRKVDEQFKQKVVEPIREREAALDALTAHFNAASYGPGETVTGYVEVPTAIECRGVRAGLRFAGLSCEGVLRAKKRDELVTIHNAPLEGGEEIPFSFTLPASPLAPPSETQFGKMYWAVWLELDRPKRFDAIRALEIPIRMAETSTGTASVRSEDKPPDGVGSDWDVKTRVEGWGYAPGDVVEALVEIGKPSAERDGIQVALKLMAQYIGLVDDGGDGVRETWTEDVAWQQVYGVVGSEASQTIKLQLPPDAEFSVGSAAVRNSWIVATTEPRRMMLDYEREIVIVVRR